MSPTNFVSRLQEEIWFGKGLAGVCLLHTFECIEKGETFLGERGAR